MQFANMDDVRSFFAGDEFATKCLGAHIDGYDPETRTATVSMHIDDRHHNAQGFVMGGVLFSLADFALAVSSNIDQKPSASTNHAIQFMSRVHGDVLVAVAHPDKEGRTLGFYTVDLFDGEKRHVARMTATCMHGAS